MGSREIERRRLLQAFVDLGYPKEFGVVVADNLRTEKAMGRMTGYLRGVRPTRMEDIADEMLAIMSDRDSWVEKITSEHANASITEFYNRPREPENDDGPAGGVSDGSVDN